MASVTLGGPFAVPNLCEAAENLREATARPEDGEDARPEAAGAWTPGLSAPHRGKLTAGWLWGGQQWPPGHPKAGES